VTGEAEIDRVAVPFDLVLKGWPRPPSGGDPSAWNASGRELGAYASGVLDDLPGPVRAPRFLGGVETGTSRWAWLSSLSARAVDMWSLDDFALVARHLGEMNGAWLAAGTLPDEPWMSRDFLRGKLPTCAPDVLDLVRLRDDPVVARAWPPPVVRAIRRIWGERDRWLSALDELPSTFCHLDAYRRNAFLRTGPKGDPETCLVDWAFSGVAAVGEEIAPLVTASLYVGETTGIAPIELDRAAFNGYVAGLQAAGWSGDPALARVGYTGATVLRYLFCPTGVVVALARNQTGALSLEAAFGMPVEALLDRYAEVNAWIVDIADEFRRYRRGTVGS
jgi:hypothetical protein